MALQLGWGEGRTRILGRILRLLPFGTVACALARLDGAGPRVHRGLVALGLVVPLLILFRDLLFGQLPWLDFDLLVSYQPRYQVLAAGLAEGHIPLWTGGMLGGFAVAFSEFGWFYPLTWLLLRAFDPLLAYFVEIALGLLLAGASAYWLGRVWGLSRLGAYVAACLFAYSPFVFATSRFLNYADIMFAMPAGLACVELVGRGLWRWAGPLALMTGIVAVAGHPQIALLIVYAWTIYGVFRLRWTWTDRGFGASVAALAWLVVAVGVGVATSAVRLLPTLESTALSARAGGLDFAIAAQGSIPPWSVAFAYLFPTFEIPRVLNDTLNAEELLYLGVLTPPLVLIASVVGRRNRLVVALIVLTFVSWVLAMGSFSLLFPFAHKLPLFGFFRQPARFGIVAGIGLAYLAALGLDLLRWEGLRGSLGMRWLARANAWFAATIAAGTLLATIVLTGFAFVIVPYGYDYIDRVIVGSEGRFLTTERYRLTFDQLYGRMETAFSLSGWSPRIVLIAAVLGAWLLWRYNRGRMAPRHAQWGLGAVLLVDVMLAPGHAVATVPSEWYARTPLALQAMESSDQWRVFSYRGLAQKFELSTATGVRLSRESRDLIEYIFMKETLSPNLPMALGMDSIDGYENLMSRPTATRLTNIGSERTTVPGFGSDAALDEPARQRELSANLALLRDANVRYVTSGVALNVPGLVERWSGAIPLPDWAGVTQGIYVYEVVDWAPRLGVVRTWTIEPDPVVAAGLPVSEAAILDQDPGILSTNATGLADVLTDPVYTPERVTMQVQLAAPGVVVLRDAIAPGWSVTIDDTPAAILTVNGLWRGVAAPAGSHQIVMSYAPVQFASGITISLAATGALVVLIGAAWWADRRA